MERDVLRNLFRHIFDSVFWDCIKVVILRGKCLEKSSDGLAMRVEEMKANGAQR